MGQNKLRTTTESVLKVAEDTIEENSKSPVPNSSHTTYSAGSAAEAPADRPPQNPSSAGTPQSLHGYPASRRNLTGLMAIGIQQIFHWNPSEVQIIGFQWVHQREAGVERRSLKAYTEEEK
ncbi:hypothetical protein B0H17DRAFT_1126451 [Mycena rosella]|uniref:Uncharacterized protein n=1 Tax=Mycena rosella TaxID=1033263 RepID=A0AAD7GTK3_MYCRO|nr:hypothetical protein B0H17DRAFT_1126451 [Mycena rosella]